MILAHFPAGADRITVCAVVLKAVTILGHVGGLFLRPREETVVARAAEDIEGLVGGMACISEDQRRGNCDR